MDKKMKVGLEIERKYIIAMPSVATLATRSDYTESRITQIYISGEVGETRRVRRREYPDKTLYFETVKRRVDSISSEERERELDRAEYDELSALILPGTSAVEKTRYTFAFRGQTFEIDVYPQWRSTAIMETELPTREAEVEMPPFIKIIREVTGDKAYSNAAMSREFPPEE